MQRAPNSFQSKLPFAFARQEFNQPPTSLMDHIEKVIRMPLQETPLEDLLEEQQNFFGICNGAKEYLGRLRLEAKESKENSQLLSQCKNLLGILKTFLEESLGEILVKWEKTLTSSSTESIKVDVVKSMIHITILGLEIFQTVIFMVNTAMLKKQSVYDEISKLNSAFRKLNEIVINKPSLMLMGEYQMICEDLNPNTDGGRLISTLGKLYTDIWKLIFVLKRSNQLPELADPLFNNLEIALIELIDSTEVSHNLLGYDIAMTTFVLLNDEYYISLIDVVSKWNKKTPIHNIGKLYQIIFLHGNEATRLRILGEVEGLQPEEVLCFMELFDFKMHEGFIEGNLLFQDQNSIIHKPAFLLERLGLTPQLMFRLQNIMNTKVCDELSRTTEEMKFSIDDDVLRKRFIDLMKIASISVCSPVFVTEGSLGKIHETLINIVDDSLSNPDPKSIHYVQIQIIIDILHGLFKELTSGTFEQIIDLVLRSENNACQLFTAKFGSLIQGVVYNSPTQKTILEKMGTIYHNMLANEDFLSKFKAIEGIMLSAMNSTLDQEDITVIVPPKDEDKELLRKIADPTVENGKLDGSVNKEIIGVIGERLPLVQRENEALVNKFKTLDKECPFDLETIEGNQDEELEKAFQMIKTSIMKLQEGDLSPRKECLELQMKSKVSSLLGMFDR